MRTCTLHKLKSHAHLQWKSFLGPVTGLHLAALVMLLRAGVSNQALPPAAASVSIDPVPVN